MEKTPWKALFDTDEAAAYLKVKRRTVLQWVRDGKLPAHKLSGLHRHVWRFLRHELDAMLEPSSADLADKGAE